MEQKTEQANKHFNSFVLICIGLAVAIIALYWPVYGYTFIRFDDEDYIVKNFHIQSGFNWDMIRWAFTKSYVCNWHPLTWLSHTLDYKLFETWAGGYHLENVGFHILNTILLFYVFVRMTKSLWPSAFIAAMFAIHPLHVESVVWISERKDLLSTLFWILTMLAYFQYAKMLKLKWYLSVLILFALGLMFKPMLVTLPFILLLFDYWPLERKFGRRLIFEKIPFVICSAVSCVITYVVQHRGGATLLVDSFSFKTRAYNAIAAYASYMVKMIWPFKLSVLYPHPGDNISLTKVVISAFVILLFSVIFIYFGRRRRFLMVGWLWYLGTLVPVIGLVQVGAQSMADRYTYMTLTGLFIIIAFSAKEFVSAKHFKMLTWLAVAVLAVLSLITFRQIKYWQNSQILFARAINVTENNYRMYDNYGHILVSQGDIDGAIKCFRRAREICPESPASNNNLGCALQEIGQLEEAETYFRYLIKLYPDYLDPYLNLGENLRRQQKYDAAIECLKKAMELSPNNVGIYIRLGRTLTDMQNLEQAINAFNKAIELDQYNIPARGHRSIALAQAGRIDEAIEDIRFVLKANPYDVMMYRNLGIFLEQKGDINGAIKAYRAGLQIDPGNENLRQLLNEISKK